LAWGFERIQISGFVAGIVVLGLVQGAYATEVLRGAILSVPPGQIEAARAMGMPPLTLAWRVTFPQMLAAAIPGACEPVADRDQGHRASGCRRLCRTDAGDPAGGVDDQGLLHLLHGGRVLYLAISLVSTMLFNRIEAWARRGQVRQEGR
jgi:polar amino acid transport system permease protein